MNPGIDVCLKFFRVLGLNPAYTGSFNSFKYFTTMIMYICVVFSCVWLRLADDVRNITIEEFTMTLEVMVAFTQGASFATALYLRGSRLKEILAMMNSFWPVTEEHAANLKYLKWMTQAFMTMNAITLIFLYVSKIYIGALILESYVPKWCPYGLAVLFQVYGIFVAAFCPLVSINLFLMVVPILISVQFRLLNDEIRKAFRSKDDRVIEEKLKRCIDHHDFLLSYYKKFNAIFSGALMIYLQTSTLMICAELYSALESNFARGSILWITATCHLIVCYAVPSQIVTNQAEQVRNSIYFSPWYYHGNRRFKHYVMSIMRMGQKDLYFRDGFVDVNMKTCMNVIQTSISFYMFLKTFEGNE